MLIKNIFERFLNTKKGKEKEIRSKLKNATLRDQCVIILEAVHERENEIKSYDDLVKIMYQEYNKYGIQILNIEKKTENSYKIECTNGIVIVDITLKCRGLPEIQKIEDVVDSIPEQTGGSFISTALILALLAGGGYAISKSGLKMPDLSNISLKPKNQEAITLEEDGQVQEKIKDVTLPKVEEKQSSSDELSICLIDPSTGSILYNKDSNKQMNMASTTKIMTAIIGLENCDDLTKEVTVTENEIKYISSEYTNMNLQVGEKISYDEIFSGLAIHSACEACNVVAKETEDYIKQKTGEEVDFIDLMNKKAKELKMSNTQWKNTYGASEEGHYTTAEDMCKLMMYAMTKSPQKEKFKKYFGQTSDYVKPATNKTPYKVTYNSTTNNSLMKGEGYTLIGKTGYTDEAGQCWVFAAIDEQGKMVIGTILSGANKATIANDVQEITRYGFKCIRKLSEATLMDTQKFKMLYDDTENTVYIAKKYEEERG